MPKEFDNKSHKNVPKTPPKTETFEKRGTTSHIELNPDKIRPPKKKN